MKLKSLLHRLLPRRERYLSHEQYQSLQTLAELDDLPPQELAGRLIGDALRQRQVAQTARLRVDTLTVREQQVAALVCRGYGNRQIAAQLFISPDTVKAHIRSVLQKLNLPTKAALRKTFSGSDFPAWPPC